MVIKNPGVRPDSPFLQAARTKGSNRIETDISLFLNESSARLIAVTGTKGKSSVASAIYWVLNIIRNEELVVRNGKAFLGGNITVSPLTFLDDLTENDDVVLELSSWQLGDLRGRVKSDGSPLLKPKVAVLTAIMPDHQDYYSSMEAYVADKRVIYQGQDSSDFIVAANDEWGRSFIAESNAQPMVYSDEMVRLVRLVPENPLTPGAHQQQNLQAAGLALTALGIAPEIVYKGLSTFPGVEHRLEFFHRANEVDFYNDSAATIPEAAAAAIEALGTDGRLILVCGGADKNLDFTALVQAAGRVKAIILLAGSGSEKLRTLLSNAGISYQGPFDDLDKAVSAALKSAVPGDKVALSPGCASFGMFLNEFDRGCKWKETIKKLGIESN